MFAYRRDKEGKWMPVEIEIYKKVKKNTDIWYKISQQEAKRKVKGKWIDK